MNIHMMMVFVVGIFKTPLHFNTFSDTIRQVDSNDDISFHLSRKVLHVGEWQAESQPEVMLRCNYIESLLFQELI